MFDSLDKLLLGLLTGFVFGFLLQKGRVAKFEVIIGQFLLRDWTVVKVMLTAVVVGSVGVYALTEAGLATLEIKPALIGGVVLGGILFGVGMAVLGYCPGTGVAACGEGHRDAIAGVAGMLVGAGVYVATYPSLKPVVHGLGDWGKVTLPQLTHTSPWFWIAGLALVAVAAFAALNILSRRRVARRASASAPSGIGGSSYSTLLPRHREAGS